MIKILLADDEHHVINHITNLLQEIDFCEINILSTTSGPDTLQIIASSHIDIAFLDINMPKTNGLQIAKALNNQWPDCQIVFLTAYKTFDYIYEANQYPQAIYLLKAESDQKILETAMTCCRKTLQNRENNTHLTETHKKEKLLLLLQEQHILREIIQGNTTENWKQYVKNSSLDINLSFDQDLYVMLMNIKNSRFSYLDSSFFMEKMEYLLGNLFSFSFVEVGKDNILWIFQEKANPVEHISYFDCLKDTMDSFLDICTKMKRLTISICLYDKKVDWKQLTLVYQFLYNAYYNKSTLQSIASSFVTIIKKEEGAFSASLVSNMIYECTDSDFSILDNSLTSMKQALYQGNQNVFLSKLQDCHQHCTNIRSMHDTRSMKIYLSIVLIYLEYIEHQKIAPKIAQEIALYPIYYIHDFPDWEHAFSYLRRLAKIIFRISGEIVNDKNQQLITSIQNYIQHHLSDYLNLTIIANYVNYNESHISRLFKRMTGTNLSEYITLCRIDAAKLLLLQTNDTIQVISQKTGFRTSQYFASSFRKNTGMTPNEYRIKNQILHNND